MNATNLVLCRSCVVVTLLFCWFGSCCLRSCVTPLHYIVSHGSLPLHAMRERFPFSSGTASQLFCLLQWERFPVYFLRDRVPVSLLFLKRERFPARFTPRIAAPVSTSCQLQLWDCCPRLLCYILNA